MNGPEGDRRSSNTSSVLKGVSIIVPCFNEEQTVPMLRRILAEVVAGFGPGYAVDVLFVDDGSTDGTLSALRKIAPDVNGEVLVHDSNRGIAEAFRTGFRAARGEIICTIDADCTFDPHELIPMVEELESARADVVSASPYHPLGRVEGVPGWRLILSRAASMLYGLILPVKLYSYTACFRVFRREVVERMRFEHPGFPGVTEMLASALCLGFSVVERPMVLRRRTTGASKMKTLKVIGDHLRLMIALLRSRRQRLTTL